MQRFNLLKATGVSSDKSGLSGILKQQVNAKFAVCVVLQDQIILKKKQII